MWIFGYGSLVWKADFPYVKKIVGFVKGYERKFWQASIDHRGVPEKPGRVVTLVPSPDPDSKVFGVTYEITDPGSIEALFTREKRYEQIELSFHPVTSTCASEGNEMDIPHTNEKSSIKDPNPDPFMVVVFIGAQDGPLFLGDASLQDMAEQIANAEGPSGPNRDYVFKLAEFMRAQIPGAEDPHLFDLERELLAQIGKTSS